MIRAISRRWAAHAFGVAMLALAVPAAGQGDPLADFDAYVRAAVAEWGAPGLAIAVVHEDEVVFARGYGTRELGTSGDVDAHTIFSSGSTTKAFTTAALGMLVDEGRLSWEDRVAEVLPGFQLRDPYVTRELTVRDMLTHRSGLAGGGLLWYGSDNEIEDVVRLLRHQEPSSSFRSTYAYNNNMYAAAGEVVEAVSGEPWADFVRRRILEPLGMDRTLMLLSEAGGRENVAQPHDVIEDELVPIRYRDLDNIAPAGSMMTSVHDMTAWLRFHLAGGEVDGRRLISEATHREMFTPQFLVPSDDYYPAAELAGAHFRAYGLGWFLQDYRGRKLIMHTGSIDGMSAITAMVPEADLGMVAFINRDHSELRHALMYRVLDAFIGGPQRDWSSELLALDRAQRARADSARAEMRAQRVEGTTPSLPLAEYAGDYSHVMYGTVEIREEAGTLVARRGTGYVGQLEHWHYDTFRVTWEDPAVGPGYLTFRLGTSGEPSSLFLSGGGEFARDSGASQ